MQEPISARGSPFWRDPSFQRFVVLIVLFVVCGLTGGSYRPDTTALLVLRPVLIVGIGVLILIPGKWRWTGLKAPLALLTLFASTMALQLVPLPSNLWLMMPGHASYASEVVGMAQPARPISLTPDLTINSLLALLPALAVLMGFAGMNSRHRWNLVWVIIALILVSAAFGVLQAAGGPDSPAFLYGQGEDIVPTGLFANRNHHAVAMGSALPLLAVVFRRALGRRALVAIGSAATAVVLVPLILLTGSRQGAALGSLSMAGAVSIALAGRVAWQGKNKKWAILGAVGVPVAVVALTLIAGRAVSIERAIGAGGLEGEMRFQAMPTMLQMTRDFMPWGIGYGAFEPLFRGYEPEWLLRSTYLNRAHNDLLEIVMSGGVFAVLVVVLFLAFLVQRTLAIVRCPLVHSRWTWLGRAAVLVIAVFLSASLIDYPLRTGLASMIFATAICWLSVALHHAEEETQGRRGAAASGRA